MCCPCSLGPIPCRLAETFMAEQARQTRSLVPVDSAGQGHQLRPCGPKRLLLLLPRQQPWLKAFSISTGP